MKKCSVLLAFALVLIINQTLEAQCSSQGGLFGRFRERRQSQGGCSSQQMMVQGGCSNQQMVPIRMQNGCVNGQCTVAMPASIINQPKVTPKVETPASSQRIDQALLASIVNDVRIDNYQEQQLVASLIIDLKK